jgi:hypothetical protein
MSQLPDDSKVYVSCSPDQLPQWCRTLLDPAVPLPENIAYIKRNYSPNIPAMIVTAIPAVFAIIMTVVDGLKGKLHFKEWLALFSVFTAPLAICLYMNRRSTILGREIEEGRLLMGLFLTPAALLVRMTPDTCSMIPKQWISRFDVTVLNPGRGNKPGTYSILVYYLLQDGVQAKERHISFACPQLQGYMFEHEKLKWQLGLWLKNQFLGPINLTAGQSPAANKKRRKPLTPDDISRAKRQAWQEEEALKRKREEILTEPKTRRLAAKTDGTIPKHSWERHCDDGHNYYCNLSAPGIVISYEDWRHNVQSEMGGSVTFQEFLGGEYQVHIENDFGREALEEIIASVEYFADHPDAMKHMK